MLVCCASSGLELVSSQLAGSVEVELKIGFWLRSMGVGITGMGKGSGIGI